jgi:hypothetical protein
MVNSDHRLQSGSINKLDRPAFKIRAVCSRTRSCEGIEAGQVTLPLRSLPAVDDDSSNGLHRRSQTLFEAKISLRELFHLRARLTERV